jgi:hypothetical protein
MGKAGKRVSQYLMSINVVTADGLHHFKVMPLVLCSALATFQRMTDAVLSGLKWTTCLVYLDDIIVYKRTFDEHVKGLRLVLDRLRGAI